MKAIKKNGSQAFTLVELVVVIAVIAILAAVLIPTFGSIVKSANNSADQQLVTTLNKIAAVHRGNTNNEFEFADNIRKTLDEDGYEKGSLVTKNSDVIIVYNTLTNKFERKVLTENGDQLVAFAEDDGNYIGYYPEEIFKDQIIISTGGNAFAEAIYDLHNIPSGEATKHVRDAYNKIPASLKDKVKLILQDAVIIDNGGNAVSIDFTDGEPTVVTAEKGTKVIFSEEVTKFDLGSKYLPDKVIIPNNVTKISGASGTTKFAENTDAVEDVNAGTCTIEQARGSADSGSTGGDANHYHDFIRQNANERYLASPATCEKSATYYYSCECGEKDAVNTFESGELAEHKLDGNYTAAKAATCTEAGNIDYRTCEVCEKNFDNDGEEIANVTIDALNHDWADEWTSDENGNHYRKCLRSEQCGAYDVDTVEECKLVPQKIDDDNVHRLSCGECGYQTTEAHDLGKDGACKCGYKHEGCDDGEIKLLATFTLGANGEAYHYDGTAKAGADAYVETVASYTLNVTGGTQFYTGARDEKGNGCFKLGSVSATGSFSFTVGDDVKQVIIYVAAYKTNTASISVNGGGAFNITDHASDNGEYYALVIDTTTKKEITVSTTSSVKRCMINTVQFLG